MATVDLTSGNAVMSAAAPHGKSPRLVEKIINFADAVTTKGSALASSDVFEVLDIPANTIVMGGGVEVITAMTGTSTDLTLDVGVTGGDVDNFVDGFDYDGASVGDYSTATLDAGWVFYSAADTVDILTVTQTGTFTGGKLRVWALMWDVSGADAPGVAAPGS
jgi:hypothetical protein